MVALLRIMARGQRAAHRRKGLRRRLDRTRSAAGALHILEFERASPGRCLHDAAKIDAAFGGEFAGHRGASDAIRRGGEMPRPNRSRRTWSPTQAVAVNRDQNLRPGAP